MYNEHSKEYTIRYNAEHRERIHLNFPIGRKDKYLAFAEFCGKSFTALIDELITKAMEECDYDEEKYLKEYLEHKKEKEEIRALKRANRIALEEYKAAQKAAENVENAAPEE